MTSQVFVLGGGGHGLVVLDALQATGISVAGVLDPALPVGSLRLGVPVLGGDEFLSAERGDYEVAVGLGVANGLAPRILACKRLLEQGTHLLTVVHNSAVLGQQVNLGEGSQIMAGSVLQAGAVLEIGVVVNTKAIVDHEVRLGAYAFIGPGAVICGGVVVEEGVFVGAGAIVLPGVTIGKGSTVGAGAVVLTDVDPGTIVVGNPAQKLRR